MVWSIGFQFFLTEGLLNWYLETKKWPRGCCPCLKEGFKFLWRGGVVLWSLFAVQSAESSAHDPANIL